MKYIIMCGGSYELWQTPRQLIEIHGEPIVKRTIRLLRENGVEDIAISSNDPRFEDLGVPVLHHENRYQGDIDGDNNGLWTDAFYPSEEPICYLFGDVVFSPEAIKTIVETDTYDIEFFGSAPPFAPEYIKQWAEPFALKVVDQFHLRSAIFLTEAFYKQGMFRRKPIMWELWQVIKIHQLNDIDYSSYVVINDYTCDIDFPWEVERFEEVIK